MKSPEKIESARKESADFNKYYGAGSSEVVWEEDGDLNFIPLLRMQKIAGTKVGDLISQPPHMEQLRSEMIERMKAAGVDHPDLHFGNILYDAASGPHGIFNPIDFGPAGDEHHR